MGRTRSRIIAGAMALFAAALAGYTLRPTSAATSATLAARTPAVEVRTVVIHRTIHVVRHAHRRRGAQVSPARRVAGRAAITAGGHTAARPVAYAATARTRTSGSHAVAAAHPGSTVAPAAPTTRTSGSHASGSAPAAPAASAPSTAAKPVTTRTSGSHSSGTSAAGSGSTASKPVTTRSSGSGSGGSGASHDDGSKHGDD